MIEINYECDDFEREFKEQFWSDEKDEVKDKLYHHFVTRERAKRREREMN